MAASLPRRFATAGVRAWPLIALLIGVGACATAPAAEAARGPLDGVTINAAFVDQDGRKQGDDTLVFAAGKLEAPGIRRAFAFAPAPYVAKKDKSGAITFTATLTSAEHGSLAIVGHIAKAAASGTRTWSKPGKAPIEHAFSGSVK